LKFGLARSPAEEVTRSCGEVNDLIKGLFGSKGFSARFRQPSILAMVICPDASKAQNDIAAVSAPFGALGRQRALGLDPPLKLFVQSPMAGLSNHDRIRRADRFPLAFRKARKSE
jgi:hypothetical protein